MSALQIKCYLLEEPSLESVAKSKEIRRFTIAPTSSTGFYSLLVDKIQQAFSSRLLPEKDEVKTYWLDDENEMVCFSSDGELQFAVDVHMAQSLSAAAHAYPQAPSSFSSKPYEKSNGALKIYVVVRNETKMPRCHYHCRSKSRNNEDMTTSSGDEATTQEANAFHPGVICNGCQKGVFGPRYKCKQCLDYDLCSTCKGKNMHIEHEFEKIPSPFLSWWKKSHQAGNHQPWKHWRHHWRRHCRQQQQQVQEALKNFMPPHLASHIRLVNDSEQLKHIGEQLKSFLDPFGIDVSYYVDNLGRTNTSAAANKDEPSKEESTISNSKSNENAAPMQTEMTTKEDEASKNEVAETVAAAAAMPSAPKEPNEVGKSQKPSTSKPATLEAEMSGFNLIDMEKEIKFINCIEQLKGMGYSDEGGWLTRLVVAKEGNINIILDTLHPSKN